MQNILIVDDVQTDREILGRIVTGAGYQPVYASRRQPGARARPRARARRSSCSTSSCRDRTATRPADRSRAIPRPPASDRPGDVQGRRQRQVWGKRQGADDVVVKPYLPATS